MKKQTKSLSLLISLALLLTILPSTVRAEGSQEEPQPVVGECEVFVTNHTVPEDDGYTEAELLEGYFFSVSGLYEDNSSPFLAPRPALPGELSSVYNEVKPMSQLIDRSDDKLVATFDDECGHELVFILSQEEVHYVIHAISEKLDNIVCEGGTPFGEDENEEGIVSLSPVNTEEDLDMLLAHVLGDDGGGADD